MVDKGGQDPKEADTPSNKGKQAGLQWKTKGDKALRKADTLSNQGKQEGVRVKTEPREGEHTIQRRETSKGAIGDKRRQGETRP